MLIQEHNIVVLSDEVYEHLVFDAHQHRSALSFPELRERSFVVGSFGKTFHVTGWKTGYCAAAPALMQLFRQAYQFINFCGVSACASGSGKLLSSSILNILQNLAKFYQDKRDLFNQGIANSRFQFSPAQGTYFQNLDYSNIRPDLNAVDMCHFLAERARHCRYSCVLHFIKSLPDDLRLIRFCFAKKTETLLRAGEILSAI